MAQPPNNAPSPQPAAFSVVNNWVYPFPARDARVPMTALKFLAALASAEDGFYPLGVNGVWHGGIHFGDGTGGVLDQSGGVRCIADGEVVAYRIDTKYPQLTYPDGRKALYSTGFTLVRHHLVLPPLPASAPSPTPASNSASSPTPANPNTPPAPAASNTPNPADTLTFFTLYMHVLDWAGYQADATSNAPVKKSLPAYYKGKTISVVGSKAKDAQAPAVTPANAPQPADTGTSTGADTTTPPVLGIHLHDAPNGHNLGILPQGSRLTIGQIHGHWGKIASIESGTPVPLQLGGTLGPQAAQGWVYLKWLDRTGEPDPLDTIVILDPPHSVQAGDVIAYLGEYQRAGDVTTLPPQPTRPMLHLETFTGDDLPSYLTRSRARAEQLPAAQRTILVISAGAVLVQLAKPDQTLAYEATVQATADSPTGSLWVKVQQTQAASGNASPPVLQPVGAAFWISYANLASPSGCVAWSTFPLKLEGAVGPKAAYLRAIPVADLNAVAKDDQGNTWYQVPVGVDDGNTALGWVCDKNHPLVKLDSPWAWPGFEALELDASVTDLFKRSIHLSDGSVGAEKIPFEQTFEALRSSALLKKLEDILDRRGDKNGKITAVELRGALREPWLADVVQRLIVRYESEWGGEMSKWDALTSLMNDGAPVWNAEMTRINALRFWSGVAAVKEFPLSAKVYHWHPVGLVGNFAGNCNCIDVDKFVKEYKKLHSEDFGWYEHANSPKSKLPPLNDESEKNLRTLLEGIKKYFVDGGSGCDMPKIAYMLATTRIESYNFQKGIFFGPIAEGISYDKAEIDYGSGPTARRAAIARANENTEIGDGYKYRGRGLVQITWKKKYREFSETLGLPLASDPDQTLNWDVALRIMIIGMKNGSFTGHSLSDYINESNVDYRNARQIINGMDKSNIFAEYASKFESILKGSAV